MEKSVEIPESFRGLLYAPSYEAEVVLLFGFLLPYLDNRFVIDEYTGSFPDCIAKRNGKEIGIEFEVNSKDFKTHKHDQDPNLPKCKLIVCWENYWKKNKMEFQDSSGNSYEIEVLELSELIKQKGLDIIHSGKPKYEKRVIWNEKSFFSELKKNVDADKFSRIAAIYGLCNSHPEFEVVFGEGPKIASFNVRIKKWQTKKIGVRSPVQVYADGKVTIDYQKLPKNLEMELRRIMGEPKAGWHSYDMKDQKTLDKIKEAIEWFAETSMKYL